MVVNITKGPHRCTDNIIVPRTRGRKVVLNALLKVKHHSLDAVIMLIYTAT